MTRSIESLENWATELEAAARDMESPYWVRSEAALRCKVEELRCRD